MGGVQSIPFLVNHDKITFAEDVWLRTTEHHSSPAVPLDILTHMFDLDFRKLKT
jgi:hypothetical protein